MAEKVKIGVGDRLIVKDGSNEWAFIKQGTVVRLADVQGSLNKQIYLDTPACIEVVRD